MKLYISTPSSHKKCMAKAARISWFPKTTTRYESEGIDQTHKSSQIINIPKHQGYSHHHPKEFEEIPWFHAISTYKYWNPWLTSPKQTQHRKRIHSKKVKPHLFYLSTTMCFFRTGLQTPFFWGGGRATILSPISPGLSNWRQTIRAVALLRSGSRRPGAKKTPILQTP